MVNPLIGTIDMPLTRGLQAALPFVDDFLPVRTLRDVRELALHLGALNQHGHHRHAPSPRPARSLDTDAGSGGDRVVHSGCERLEPDGVDRYKAAITIGMAAITGNYEGIVTISDKAEPTSYKLMVEGQAAPDS